MHGTTTIIAGRAKSTILPILKGRNADVSSSNNYRGIALSSINCKILDNIVLLKFSDKLQTSRLQFGYKPKSCPNLCTFVVKETIAYYVKHQTTVFVHFWVLQRPLTELITVKLFKLLINRGLPAYVTRVLLNFYTGNFCAHITVWYLFLLFLATNGVKRGGVLSTVLFCVYIDGLLVALSRANVGCYIGRSYVGALAYADDLVLTAPSASALCKM